MAFELLLTGDTFNEGRVKINDGFSELSSLWTASTGSESVVSQTSSSPGNVSDADWAILQGQDNYANLQSSAIRIIGKDNYAQGSSNSHLEGFANTSISSDNIFLGGQSNEVNGAPVSFVYGTNNYNSSENSVILGSRNS